MKKYIKIIIPLLLIAFLFGCSSNKNDEEISSTSTLITEITQTTQEKEIDGTSTTTDTTKQETTLKETTKKSKDKTTTTTKKEKTTKNKTQKTSQAFTTTSNNQNGTTSTTKKALTCTFTVECTSVLKKMDKLKDGHEKYVGNGYFINSVTYEFNDGDTVYDALKAVCDKNNILLSVSDSGYGKYISGINNIDEKDCGSSSGWVYTVNSKSPSKACSKYTLSNGDVVAFSFVC